MLRQKYSSVPEEQFWLYPLQATEREGGGEQRKLIQTCFMVEPAVPFRHASSRFANLVDLD